MNVVQLSDIVVFFDNVLDVFGPYLVYSFAIMIAFALLFGIRKLILGER